MAVNIVARYFSGECDKARSYLRQKGKGPIIKDKNLTRYRAHIEDAKRTQTILTKVISDDIDDIEAFKYQATVDALPTAEQMIAADKEKRTKNRRLIGSVVGTGLSALGAQRRKEQEEQESLRQRFRNDLRRSHQHSLNIQLEQAYAGVERETQNLERQLQIGDALLRRTAPHIARGDFHSAARNL